MTTKTEKTELAYQAYRKYSLVTDPTTFTFEEFLNYADIVLVWEAVVDVVAERYSDRQQNQAA